MPESLPLAVQLYTLRDLPGTFEDKLRAVAEGGYTAVESVGTHGLAAEDLRAALATFGLGVISSHVAYDVLREDLDVAIDFAKRVGNDTLVVPYLSEPQRPTDAAGWTALGEELNGIGARCAGKGLRLIYHNHDFEMVEHDGRRAIEWLLDAAEPANLGFEPDVAWIVRGGGDPIELLDRYRGRCPRMHVKDLAPPGKNEDEGGWAAVGEGVLDWERYVRAGKVAGVEWFIVEHDNPRNPAENIRRSFEYLAQLPELG
jgi:sugar phosphate isomerase/epimerase